MLDQEIAPARPVGQERTYLYQRLRIDLTALWRAGRAAPAIPPPSGGSRGGQLLGYAHFTLSKLEKNATESVPASPNPKSHDRYFRSTSVPVLVFSDDVVFMMWF